MSFSVKWLVSGRGAGAPVMMPDAGGWLAREIEFEYAQVREASLADPVKPFTNAQFEADVDALRAFASARGAFVMDEVTTGRAQAGLNRRVPVR